LRDQESELNGLIKQAQNKAKEIGKEKDALGKEETVTENE